MKITYVVLIIGFLLVSASCAPRLSTMGEPVQVVSDELIVLDCQYRGAVTGSTSRGWSRTQNVRGSFNDLRNRTAILGGDTVLIVSRESMFEQIVLTGRAYDCI